jgi:hypothetical protein
MSNRGQGHYNDRRICEMVTLNETHYYPATFTFLSVVCFVLKFLHTQIMLLLSHLHFFLITMFHLKK